MKTNRLILIVLAVCSAGFAQAQIQDDVVGLKWNENNTQLDLVTINPAEPAVFENETPIVLGNDRKYMPNTLTYVKGHNTIYFFTQSEASFAHGVTQGQQLEVANAKTGGSIRSLKFTNTTLMAPFVLPGKNQIGFIATERTFNSYGNNDDNIALVVFDMNSGEMAHRIDLPSLSLSAMSTPFVGKAITRAINGNVATSETDVSMSSPCLIPSMETVLFAAKDVMGVNRLYRVDLNSGRLVSKLALSIDVLDMEYDVNKEVVKTLYITNDNGTRSLRVGEMTLNGTLLETNTLVRTFADSEENITDGDLEFDAESNQLTAVKLEGMKQVFYTFDSDLNLIGQQERYITDGKVDIEFPTTLEKSTRVDFDKLIKMYPNPAQDDLTIETEDLTKVYRITVYDNVGQEVKDVDVQSNNLSNIFDISALKPGLYMVEIQSTGVTTVTKKLVVQ
ncbi:MAG: hypothetical protein ACI8SE_001427 [Bacteroidia bacterium]|jgi:hypothetical protein